MQKVKFDFEAIKESIFVKQSANVPVGAPVDQNGNVANDGTAHGIVICAKKQAIAGRFVKNLTVMVAGYCDIIDAQNIWGNEYSAEAKSAMSDIVFCDNHELPTGGGGWPADLPKPSVGGYGYTEQGEQTAIAWDGDTEGKTIVEVEDFATTLALVSDKTPSSVIGGTFEVNNGDSYNIDTSWIALSGEWGYVVGDGHVAVIFEDGTTVDELGGVTFEHKGVYFYYDSEIDEYTSSLTYGTPDTVHKIDEKYLPASGGGIFEIFYNIGTNTVDKTYAEIKQAYYAGKNVTLRIGGDAILQVSMMPMSDDDSDIVFSCLANIYIDPQTAEVQAANIHQVIIYSDDSVTYQQGYFGF